MILEQLPAELTDAKLDYMVVLTKYAHSVSVYAEKNYNIYLVILQLILLFTFNTVSFWGIFPSTFLHSKKLILVQTSQFSEMELFLM